MMDVLAFAQKFGMLVGQKPGHLTPAKMGERIKFLQEELDELMKSAKDHDLAEMADALVDLVYVAKGTALMLGIAWEDHWNTVQAANMLKVRGMTKRGNKVDVTKPEGWRPPCHDDVLSDSGYKRGQWVDADNNLITGRDDENPHDA
jgi:predicted HAD superfamily Cof-like phosphohydrolase